jgi:putative multiple sugar transport system permease protein
MQTQATFREELKERARSVRDYGMYVALILIFIVFEIATHGLFLSSRNIANLVTSTSYTAIMAIGMTLVIIIRHIDLSVGYLSGALGAVAGLSLQFWGFPVGATIVLVLLLGIGAGLVTGTLVAQLRIPAFVATLAGWLFYRGLLQLLTRSGTIVIENSTFNAIGNGYIPDIPHSGALSGVHLITLILGLLGIVFFIWTEIRKRRNAMSFGFKVEGTAGFVVRLAIVSMVIAAITWILAGYHGLSWAAFILAIIALFYAYVTNRTTIGRHIYAVGGNPEAAQLNGISVKRITFLVFASMGFLTAIGGMIYASWLRSATTIAGQGLELDVIAAAFVGGVAVSGGVGRVTGAIVGALVMASLTNGMNLLGFDISIQYIVRALVLAGAVIFDVQTRRKK